MTGESTLLHGVQLKSLNNTPFVFEEDCGFDRGTVGKQIV